ncbi:MULTISPECIES: hypothetical protein [unclassified Microcoleus]|uniref:hypothetical protein n=1 Tax=unclassified Microcoleus TaxID=2642155 RepID=UPI002FCE7537
MNPQEDLPQTQTQDEPLPPPVEKPVEKPITAQISWNIAIAVIRCIQFTARYGEDEDDQIAKAVCFARKLQNLLDPNSKEFLDLDSGWQEVAADDDPQTLETLDDYIGEEPLDKFEDSEDASALLITDN